ncbi:MAG: hypothetical protein HOC23_23410 [Halieaceae bacterium]|jgi:hypothetical protein|nr:hypothetical protein [Halieaceae bacterium]
MHHLFPPSTFTLSRLEGCAESASIEPEMLNTPRSGSDHLFPSRGPHKRSSGERLVMQVCIAEEGISPLYRLSIERARAYARRIGADYRLITEGYPGYAPHFAILRAYEMQYEKIFAIDCDAIVMDECPDVFEIGEFAAAADSNTQPGINPVYYQAGRKRSLGIRPEHIYFNSGVVLFTREFLDRTASAVEELIPDYDGSGRDLSNQKDQLLLNEIVGKHYGTYLVLDPDWNGWFEPTRAKYIQHYADCSRAQFDEAALRARLRPIERSSNIEFVDSTMRCFAWADSMGPELERLHSSTDNQGVELEVIGLGQEFDRSRFAKLDALELAVRRLPADQVVLCTDGYDVLYVDPPGTILRKFLDRAAPLLFSVERLFTHHYTSHREHFDRESGGSPYRYPNSGGLIGRAGAIMEMLDELRNVDRDEPLGHVWGIFSDQTLVGDYIARHPGKIALDFECDIFWCTAGEWGIAAQNSSIVEGRIWNPTTQTQPSIVHVPWREHYDHVLELLHERLVGPIEKHPWCRPVVGYDTSNESHHAEFHSRFHRTS